MELIRHSEDPEIIADLLDKLDLDRPFLFGKAIGKKLVNAKKELEQLKAHLSRQSDRPIKKEALPVINKALGRLNKVFSEHGDMLKKISYLQNKRKEAIRSALKKAAKGAVITGGVATIAMLSSLTTIIGITGVFRGTILGFIKAIGQEWISTEATLRGVNDLRRKEQIDFENRLAAMARERDIARNELRTAGRDAGRDF